MKCSQLYWHGKGKLKKQIFSRKGFLCEFFSIILAVDVLKFKIFPALPKMRIKFI
jgi:hypothetical protein